MRQDLNLSVKAVLARCGTPSAAREYCINVASQYPHLRDEYTVLADACAQTRAAGVGA